MTEQLSSVTASNTIAVQAIQALGEMEIQPTPRNYEVWYVHIERTNTHLSTEIEAELSRNDCINEDFLHSIHKKYLSRNSTIKYIEDFANSILSEANALKKIVNSVDNSTKELNEDLERIPAPIVDENVSTPALDEVISALFDATQKAIERNTELERDLSIAATKIETLQVSIQEIADDAETDHLTQLKNRRFFDQSISNLAKCAQEEGSQLCLIVADIDHFKSFNDKWGHKVGDQVLKLVASALRDNVKGQDIVARYGGEEFVIALPDTTKGNATKLAETIRESVSKRRLINKSNGGVLGNITMSFGVAALDESYSTENLFEKADKALYLAKNNGRNRVVPL